METAILVLIAIILGMFVLRVIWGALRFVYRAAPFIVIWAAIILGILYADGQLPELEEIRKELRKVDNAADIRTAKN